MRSEREIVLLGPQRLHPTLFKELKARRISGPLAVVTAGWEEREPEDQELRDHVGTELRNLAIYNRVEDIFGRDTELFGAMRERHDTLRKLQVLYRMRLAHALESARELLRRKDDDSNLIDPERAGAIETVRRLDAEHLERIREVHAQFVASWNPAKRKHVVRHRKEIAAELKQVGALCIAGGHVAILLNRMRLLNVLGLAEGMPIFAWSAGAMVLGERIVLFHDSPPQGAGDAEVLEAGFGLCPNLVPLPHASRRLRLEDQTRVALFARRFGPATCIVLDDKSSVSLDRGKLSAGSGTKQLTTDGLVEELEAA